MSRIFCLHAVKILLFLFSYAGDLDVKVGFGAVTAGISKVQVFYQSPVDVSKTLISSESVKRNHVSLESFVAMVISMLRQSQV